MLMPPFTDRLTLNRPVRIPVDEVPQFNEVPVCVQHEVLAILVEVFDSVDPRMDQKPAAA
jgi:hypothetical protein